MGRSRTKRHVYVLVVMLVWVISLFGHSYGSRQTQLFKVQPNKAQTPNHFLGFLPKATPFPASGPSRKHNDIGFQSSIGKP
ncbi:hypothetical protein Lal_00011508 [Lupinus albus]|uniref:Uncharacterized protein n=1 Tax=Lupinus albus TaxID=3870 RepID=A0A6A4QDM4_LUPAL|nr:hypothetical protein Lalb_Chr06g0161521 [Lupinus albus]KAF1880450.1 hypothetical protein Lal_00011508 [Lupinus albus]